MIYGVYSVKDVLVGFNNPFILVNDQVAVRSFQHSVKGKPEQNDMQLWRLGTFNDQTGLFENNNPEMLAIGKED